MSEIDAVVAENLTMKYIAIMFSMNSLKVCKFQKQIFLFSFPPKNERNYFLIFLNEIKCLNFLIPTILEARAEFEK